jgi:DNA replication protein DnaC
MNEELDQLLSNLSLVKIRQLLPEALSSAQRQQPTYEDFLLPLLRAQWHDHQDRSLSWRIKRAGVPVDFTLESFPFSRQPGVNRRQIKAFAALDFISRAENIVLIGKPGVGKTGLAAGLLLKALHSGYRGRFVKAQDLFDEMYASLADRSSRSLVRHLSRLDVLVIDELSYLNLRPEQANIFFKLVEERYRRKPTIITTNLIYDEWANFLGNRPMTDALLSRLRHQCHTVHIDGPSLRDPDPKP